MTDQELRLKYRLLKLVAEDGARSFHALDASGRMVFIHYLPRESPESANLLAQVEELGAVDQRRIIERLEVDGGPVLVTQYIQGFESLRAWLHTRLQQASDPPVSPPGDLTSLFGPSGSKPERSQQSPAADPSPSSPQQHGAPGAAGDWTSLFGSSNKEPTAKGPPAAPPPSAASAGHGPSNPKDDKPRVRWREQSPERSDPDSPLVRWKKERSAEEPAGKGETPPKPPGELTRLFGSSDRSTPEPPASRPPIQDGSESARGPRSPVQPSSPPNPAGRRPVPGSPGEYTRLFHGGKQSEPSRPEHPELRDYVQALNAPAGPPIGGESGTPKGGQPLPPQPPDATPPPKAPGEFTRLMAGAQDAAAPGRPPVHPLVAQAHGSGAPPSGAAGPGAFTRVVAGAQVPMARPPDRQAGVEQEPVGEEGEQQRPKRVLALLVALGVLTILAIALIAYVVL